VDSLGTDFDGLVTRGAIGALVLAGGWAVVVLVAVAVEARTAGRVSLAERAGCPRFLRLWLLGVFVAVLSGVAPAQASDAGSGPAGPGLGPALDAALDGLPLPDRADGTPAQAVVVVRPGDSLWLIARRLLPARAPDSAIADAVARLYGANRRTIGPDPDLLDPGQRLLVDRPDTNLEAR
jgi:nucleoid-associated protein YgaU